MALQDTMLNIDAITIYNVRKEVHLEQPERMEEAVAILNDWIKKQDHFVKKDYSTEYLEKTLIFSKGLIERAKQKLDKLCTYKTLMPEFFQDITKADFSTNMKHMYQGHLPKLTKENYRVLLLRFFSDNYAEFDIMLFCKYVILMCEYLKRFDYNSGIVLITDFREANILNFVTKLPPTILSQLITLGTEAYSFRIKSINLISNSKTVDVLLGFGKQIFSKKLSNRIILHKKLESLHDVVPKDILPKEYGGSEMSLKELNEQWIKVLKLPAIVEYFDEMSQAVTDENYRQTDKFNDAYVGVPGSFRMLRVD